MADHDVEARVKAVLADVLDLDPESVGPETSSQTVEAWDSLMRLTVVMALEDEFGVAFDDEESVAATSFLTVVATIEGKL